MKILKKMMIVTMCLLMFLYAGPINVMASSSEDVSISVNQLETVIDLLNDTPNSLLENDKLLKKYHEKNNIYFFKDKEDADNFIESRVRGITTYGFKEDLKCAGAIAFFIGGAGATITGIKSLVKAAGGVKALASALLTYYKTGKEPDFIKTTPTLWEMFRKVGTAISTITGLDNCVSEAY